MNPFFSLCHLQYILTSWATKTCLPPPRHQRCHRPGKGSKQRMETQVQSWRGSDGSSRNLTGRGRGRLSTPRRDCVCGGREESWQELLEDHPGAVTIPLIALACCAKLNKIFRSAGSPQWATGKGGPWSCGGEVLSVQCAAPFHPRGHFGQPRWQGA